ncbi:uncharacterized protein LOC118417599 [Branchiostoma floridae]|uniref:Uncharacterized protein LOC118417599 n=1 Tax=Branchiostoma floridae TaxID=7739 RepID=A0A9J7LA97_BRAFL|nr:uncharacterized protein LOC118417599 [Branchiostoma floridae]
MAWSDTAASYVLLVASLTVNVSAACFFLLPPGVAAVLRRVSRRFPSSWPCQVLNMHEDHPWTLGKYLVDQLSSCVLCLWAVCALATTDVFQRPFRGGFSANVAAVFAANIGHYVYKCFQDFHLRDNLPNFRINFLHHAVTVLVYIVFSLYQQSGLFGLLGVLFEGTVIFYETSKLMQTLDVERHSVVYGVNIVIGSVMTLVLRGVVPIVFFVLAFRVASPFEMDYLPLAFYFLSVIFFAIINIWLLRASVYSVRRFFVKRKLHIYAQALQPRSSVIVSNSSSRSSSPASSLRSTQGLLTLEEGLSPPASVRNTLTKKNDFARLTPVANANINANVGDDPRYQKFVNTMTDGAKDITRVLMMETLYMSRSINTGERVQYKRPVNTVSRAMPIATSHRPHVQPRKTTGMSRGGPSTNAGEATARPAPQHDTWPVTRFLLIYFQPTFPHRRLQKHMLR